MTQYLWEILILIIINNIVLNLLEWYLPLLRRTMISKYFLTQESNVRVVNKKKCGENMYKILRLMKMIMAIKTIYVSLFFFYYLFIYLFLLYI